MPTTPAPMAKFVRLRRSQLRVDCIIVGDVERRPELHVEAMSRVGKLGMASVTKPVDRLAMWRTVGWSRDTVRLQVLGAWIGVGVCRWGCDAREAGKSVVQLRRDVESNAEAIAGRGIGSSSALLPPSHENEPRTPCISLFEAYEL